MATDAVKPIVSVLDNINGMVEEVGKNNDKCRHICALVDALRENLKLFGTEGVTGESVRAVLQRHMKILAKMQKGVYDCRHSVALLVKFFDDNGTAAVLGQLRQDLLVINMVQVTSVTNNLAHKMDEHEARLQKMEQKMETIVALLRRLQSNKLPSDSADDDTNISNKETLIQGLGTTLAQGKKKQGQGYTVLTEDELKVHQSHDMVKVAMALSIKPGVAELLLRHYKWSSEKVVEEWHQNGMNTKKLVRHMGLTTDRGREPDVSKPINISCNPDTCRPCGKLFDEARMMSLACFHYYCNDCWNSYLGEKVKNKKEGDQCVALLCPHPNCNVPVLHDLVTKLPGSREKVLYLKLLFRSYVDNSDGRRMWCPGKCGRAIMFDDDRKGVATDVVCRCGHKFCSTSRRRN